MKRYEEALKSKSSVFEQVTEDVLFPLMSDFIQWVIRSAHEKGMGRLYFLARDGYFMHLTAEILTRMKTPSIECRYLYCSRYSVRLPSFFLYEKECLELICRGGIDVTLRKIFRRAGLNNEEIEKTAESMNMSGRLDDILEYREIRNLIPVLSGNAHFMSLVYSHSREAYENTVGYFRQEGMMDNISYALVDSGWTGTMQESLKKILKSMGRNRKLEGYYFGLYGLPLRSDFSEYHTYYFSVKGHIKRKVYFSNSLFEGIFSAPHGMTVGYQRREGKYYPKMENRENLNQAVMVKLRNQMIPFMERMAEKLPVQIGQWPVPEKKQQRRLFCKLSRFMGRPDSKQAEIFGSLRFSDDVLEINHQMIAEKMDDKEMKDNQFLKKILRMLGITRGPIKESAWMEGSIVRSGKNISRYLWENRFYKYMLYFRKSLTGTLRRWRE